jgi:PAS domain S-box-containing protein
VPKAVQKLSGDWTQFANVLAFSEPQQLLAAYFNSATVGLAICDRELRFQAVNPALAIMNGIPAEAHVGKTLREVLGDAAEVVEPAFRSVLTTGRPVLNLEVAMRLPTRKELGYWMENYFPVTDASGQVKQVGAVVIEITAQKKLEECLHSLSGKVLRIKDEEQQRIARELHDSISQYHAALKMNLRLLKRARPSLPKGALLLEQSLELLELCIIETRTISHLLHPPFLDQMGFASAAQWYVKGFAKRSGIRVNLHLGRDLAHLPAEAEVALFRVLQEALANVHRHAHSPEVEIAVAREMGRITLRVGDRGRGIAAEKLRHLEETGEGVGVRSMRERILELGGQFHIRSSRRGTLVEVSIPLGDTETDAPKGK